MAQIRVNTTVALIDTDGSKHDFAFSKAVAFTTKEYRTYSLSASSTQIVFDPSTDGSETMSDFDFLMIASSANAMVELTCDVGDDVGNEASTIKITKDAPLILFADDSYANVTGVDALGTGTLDVIDKIRVKDLSGGTNTIRVLMGS